MPKKLLLVLFILCSTSAQAQLTYKKCTVYSKKREHSADSFVRKVLLYNQYGKVTEQRDYYKKKDEPVELTGATYYTYTKDTLLLLEKHVCLRKEGCIVNDTNIIYYAYNKNNKLDYTISASYGRGGYGCMVGGDPRWYDSTKTGYYYDAKGNLTHQATSDITWNMGTGFSLSTSPNFRAYTYDNNNRVTSIRYLAVHTLEYDGSNFIKEYGYDDTTVVAKEVYSYHNRCYTIDMVVKDWDKTIHHTSYVFYDSAGNTIQEYTHGGSTLIYNVPIERFYAQPGKRLIKEIWYDNEGRPDMVDSYIYE